MKNIFLLVTTVSLFFSGFSQTLNFTVANPQPNIMESYGGTFASGDIDGDGDKDLFMTGITPQIRTKLYLNTGSGNFTEVTHNFPRSGSSQAFLKDLDNDGDLDLFFSGQNELQQMFTNIYRNNGSGVFTQVPNNLPLIIKGATITDIDNDGDQDIVITSNSVAGVYLNNGNAIFTPQGGSIFTPVSGVVQFIDIENDGDKDIIISGLNSTKLYINNGSGNFSMDTRSTLPSISGTDIDVADTDNDGDLDFLINGSGQNILYLNNGLGVFSPITTTLQQTSGGQNAIADLDNDGDQDILIVGTQAGGLPNIYNIVYRNTGNNTFVQTQILGGEYIAECVIEDFNADGLKDIIIQGFAYDTNFYWNTTNNLNNTDINLSDQGLIFYPNPAKDIINFKLHEEIESINIINIFGQEVLSKQINSNEFVLDISYLSNGTYIVKLNHNRNSKNIKLIKI